MRLLSLKYHIIENIKLIASDAAIQLSYYPDFTCKGDEIVNGLGDWLSLYKQKNNLEVDDSFLPEEITQIISLDEDISLLPSEKLCDAAIINSEEWTNIRKKAKEILNLLKVEYSLPDKRSI